MSVIMDTKLESVLRWLSLEEGIKFDSKKFWNQDELFAERFSKYPLSCPLYFIEKWTLNYLEKVSFDV